MAKDSRRRQKGRWDENDARVVLAEWRRSGLSAAAFARRGGYSAMRLYYWADRLPEPTSQAAVEFVPVPIADSPASGVAPQNAKAESERGSVIELERNGVVIRVREDLDTARIEQLCTALMRGGSPC